MEALAGVMMLVVVLRKPMTCGQGVVSLGFDDSGLMIAKAGFVVDILDLGHGHNQCWR